MDAGLLKLLPSTYYRVAIKALIFDNQQRLLVSKNDKGEWEIPGGGWEHDESVEDCLRRELDEELVAKLSSVGAIRFAFSAMSERGWRVARIFYEETITPGPLKPSDDQVEARYVTRAELLELPFCPADTPIKDYVDMIWPSAIDKTAVNL
jgi:8-oxo-dGTP diphosphatase